MSRDATLESYFTEAASWDRDRFAMNTRSARIAWRVASFAILALIVSLVALLALLPLKRVDPFVIRVDNATGVVDVVPVYAGQASLDEAVTRYFLSHYVSVCERFNFSTAESDYEECGAFHAPQRNQAWLELWTRTNPASPLNVHKDGSSVGIQVGAVSFFTGANGLTDLAQVRYRKSERQGTAPARVTHWIATVHYAYADPARDPKTRRWNPLGFKIIEFKSEPEVQGQPTPAEPEPGPAAARGAGAVS